MKVEIKDVTASNLGDLPEACRRCVYWSFPEEFEETKAEPSKHRQELEAKKKRWILQTLKESGECGKVLYCNDLPVGCVEYGPSSRFPNIRAYESQPIGRKGLGQRLLESVIAELKERGFKALETYARRGSSNNPSGPVEFYMKNGFHIKDETSPNFVIVRLDL